MKPSPGHPATAGRDDLIVGECSLFRPACPDLSDEAFAYAADILYQLTGISLNASKRHLVRTRLSRRLAVTGAASFEDYLNEHVLPGLAASPEATGSGSDEVRHFIDALSTNLTSFFRESAHFDYLSREIMPALFTQASSRRDRRVRLWSAGCSSGEEAYCIAMTTLDALDRWCGQVGGREHPSLWDVKVLATDISSRVLAHATNGVYDEARCEQIPPSLRGRYFSPRLLGGVKALAVSSKLRDVVRFRRLNLLGDWPSTGKFDAVFCRNVMIYFDKASQTRVVNRIHESLAPGGYFFTGHSESLTGIEHRFNYCQATIYRRD